LVASGYRGSIRHLAIDQFDTDSLGLMDQILDQLGGLVLGAVPTMLFFILLIVAYGLLVRRPLDAILAERRARTSGAMDKAREAITAAESETAAYEEKLRQAKAEIYTQRESRIRQWTAERDRVIEEARRATSDRIARAKAEIEDGATAARRQIEDASVELGEQILRVVMPSSARPEVAQ
jgi:F-type H+-transporting ATPase subunit b